MSRKWIIGAIIIGAVSGFISCGKPTSSPSKNATHASTPVQPPQIIHSSDEPGTYEDLVRIFPFIRDIDTEFWSRQCGKYFGNQTYFNQLVADRARQFERNVTDDQPPPQESDNASQKVYQAAFKSSELSALIPETRELYFYPPDEIERKLNDIETGNGQKTVVFHSKKLIVRGDLESIDDIYQDLNKNPFNLTEQMVINPDKKNAIQALALSEGAEKLLKNNPLFTDFLIKMITVMTSNKNLYHPLHFFDQEILSSLAIVSRSSDFNSGNSDHLTPDNLSYSKCPNENTEACVVSTTAILLQLIPPQSYARLLMVLSLPRIITETLVNADVMAMYQNNPAMHAKLNSAISAFYPSGRENVQRTLNDVYRAAQDKVIRVLEIQKTELGFSDPDLARLKRMVQGTTLTQAFDASGAISTDFLEETSVIGLGDYFILPLNAIILHRIGKVVLPSIWMDVLSFNNQSDTVKRLQAEYPHEFTAFHNPKIVLEFVVAHELGHSIVRDPALGPLRDSLARELKISTHYQEETFADQLAANVLAETIGSDESLDDLIFVGCLNTVPSKKAANEFYTVFSPTDSHPPFPWRIQNIVMKNPKLRSHFSEVPSELKK